MLNRRTLRIKVMQSLFAYEQCCDANYELAKEFLSDRFSPDLNSMEFQDKPLLKARQQAALRLLDERMENKPSADQEEPVVEAVEAALQQYHRRVQADLDFLKRRTVEEIEELTDVYHSVLNLIPAFSSVAAADRKADHRAFTGNSVVKALSTHPELIQLSKHPDAGWDTRMDKVRAWFRDVVRVDEAYQQYVAATDHTPEQELTFVRHILRKVILGDTLISAHFEEHFIRWGEDREIIRGLAERTLKTTRSGEPLQLQKLSLDWEDDRFFIETLLERAARLPVAQRELIASKTVNWSVERLPLTDRVIIQMAIAEFTTQPNVPIKVTINEYIELAKDYSTPKSRQFINGILDVLSKELRKTGELKKSGRGLIDNK